MSLQRSGIAARAVGSLFILPFAAGLLIWPYGTLPLTALLIVLAAREGAQSAEESQRIEDRGREEDDLIC